MCIRDRGMATIKEIAELAGVSRGTVDRVLNNRGAVNPKTARKVLEIAQALDYKPNRAGIVLAAQKKNLKIGVILFDTGNPFFNDVIEGVNKKAEELGGYNCSFLISRVGFDLQAQLDAMDRMAAVSYTHLDVYKRQDVHHLRHVLPSRPGL